MKSESVLIIEDDLVLNDQLAHLMQTKGFQTKQVSNGKFALWTALRETFDLILLDVQLPEIDGFSLLHQLRKKKQTPVIMLTGRHAQHERINGYENGADDYIPKPFNATELMLRIDAVLRRSRRNIVESLVKKSHHQLDSFPLRLNKSHQEAFYGELPLNLTGSQFKLLWTLVENHNEVLTKPYLYQTVLDRPYSRYDRSLDMHLSRVRSKLVAAGMPVERLTTVHGKGYKFS